MTFIPPVGIIILIVTAAMWQNMTNQGHKHNAMILIFCIQVVTNFEVVPTKCPEPLPSASWDHGDPSKKIGCALLSKDHRSTASTARE